MSSIFIFSPFSTSNLVAGTITRHTTLEVLLGHYHLSKQDIIQAQQIHSAEIAIVNKTKHGQIIPQVDALITTDLGLPLLIRTADCVPIFVWVPEVPVIALIHAGREGTELEIAKKVINKIRKKWGSAGAAFQIALGPGIKKCCYEINKQTKDHYDLYKKNRDQLLASGVIEKNIIESDYCTACHTDLFYSYRKEGNTGRIYSMLMLV